MLPIISFVGKHNSGKTTFLCGVIKELSMLGVRTAVIKHASSDLSISPLNDSEKLFNAGARNVYASSPEVSIKYQRYEQEKNLEEICSEVSDGVDLIITEGYKKEPYYKIEVMRKDITSRSMYLDNTIAMVSDFELETDLALFTFRQTREMAEFIISFLALDNKD